MSYLYMYQISRKSDQKHAQSDQKKFDVVASSKFLPPHYTRPYHPYTLSEFEEDPSSGLGV